MKLRKTPYFLFILSVLIYARCATIVPPSGGPKDTTPPVPQSFVPPNKTTSYKGEKISIKFDEFIELKDLQSQLVVSPAMPEDPDVYIQGKKLIIKPSDSLQANTTYTVFLGNAVVNYKEGLPVKHFQYVFSTGEKLDSLRISGNVRAAFDLKPQEGIIVMLYKNPSDSAPYLQKPFYLAKTYSNGDFVLDNLSEGKYLIFALKDLNSNYLYDQPSEEIAFVDSLVSPAPPKPADDSLNLVRPVYLNMYLFKEKAKHQGIMRKAVIRPELAELDFKKPLTKVGLEPLNFQPEGDWCYPVFSSGRDTLKLWFTAKMPDTLFLKVSDSGKVLDTVKLVLKKPVKKRHNARRNKKNIPAAPADTLKPVVRLSVKSNAGGMIDFFGKPILYFSTPVKGVDAAKIKVLEKEDTVYKAVPFNIYFPDTLAADKLYFDINLKEETTYRIFIPDSVFFDIFGNTNDTVELRFSTTRERNYGSLILNIDYRDTVPLLIQLLNGKDAVVQQNILKDSILYYKYLKPGKYKIKAVKDRNRNGKWDTGDYLKGILPERVYFMNKTLNVRANWDIEQKWIIAE